MKFYLISFIICIFFFSVILQALKLRSEDYVPEIEKPQSPPTTTITAAAIANHATFNVLSVPKLLKRAGRSWTDEEEILLLKLRKEGKSWSEIAKLIPERTWRASQKRHGQLTRGSSEPKRKKGKLWTDEENERLMEQKEMGKSWKEIAQQLPGRNLNSIQSHYRYLLTSRKAPENVLVRYTPEEDRRLLELAKTDLSWSERAKLFPGRSQSSLQGRYTQLGQEPSIRESWTTEKDERLIELLKTDLTREEIGRLLGRTVEAVNNRVYKLRKLGRIE